VSHSGLQRSQDTLQRYALALEATNDGLWNCDLESNLVDCTPRYWELLAREPHDGVPVEEWRSWVHPDDGARVDALMAEHFHTRKPYDIELRVLTGTGAYRWYRARGQAIWDDHGRIVGHAGTLADVHGAREASDALRRSEARLRDIAETLSDWIWEIDLELTFTYSSGRLSDVLGYAPDELIGRSLLDLVMPGEEPSALALADRVRRSREPFSGIEVPCMHKQGQRVLLQLSGRPLHGDDGGYCGFRGIGSDVTQRRALEDQLRQRQRMDALGTLAGGIAHDFNNILAALLGYVELAALDVPAGSAPAGHLQQALVAGDRARTLVAQILAFSRRDDTETTSVDLALVVREAVKLLRASLPSTIEIAQRVAPDLPAITGNASQVHQVVMNLCANAEYAMRAEPSGRLEIDLDLVSGESCPGGTAADGRDGRFVRLRVRDTGTGLATEAAGRLFEPFFTTKPVGQGTGMGLAVVHGIVIAHGGMVRAQPAEGGGALFEVCLPAAPPAAPVALDRPDSVKRAASILVVDDEPQLATMLGHLLRRLGYEPTVCTSSLDALDRFTRSPAGFDLAITDQTMPGLTGERLTAELHRVRPELPIVLCTGYSYQLSEERANELRLASVIHKPYETGELARAIRDALQAIVAWSPEPKAR
jgi:PAS domain S-box-containing protein